MLCCVVHELHELRVSTRGSFCAVLHPFSPSAASPELETCPCFFRSSPLPALPLLPWLWCERRLCCIVNAMLGWQGGLHLPGISPGFCSSWVVFTASSTAPARRKQISSTVLGARKSHLTVKHMAFGGVLLTP